MRRNTMVLVATPRALPAFRVTPIGRQLRSGSSNAEHYKTSPTTCVPHGHFAPRRSAHIAPRARSMKTSTPHKNNASDTKIVLPSINDIDGNALTSQLTDKVLFVMNVASACGYTRSGYELLNKLTQRFDAANFAAVAIPCNAFGSQESGSDQEIKAFAQERASGLHLTEKSSVNGADTHPLIALAKIRFPEKITWNFEGRYVFDKSGTPVARFSNTSTDEEIIAEIEKHL